MTYKTPMRMEMFKQWALVSAPLLLVLAALFFGFSDEKTVAEYFRDHSTNHPAVMGFFAIITKWSNPVFYAYYGLMLLLAYKSNDYETRRYVLILIAVQVVVAVLAVHFVKRTVGRPRPHQNPWWEPVTSRGTYHSLPSGHTTEFMGWSLPLALRKNATLLSASLGLCVALVGFSRIYLGWHHPTDVFFGWMLGSFGGFATYIIAGTSLFRKGTTH